MSSLYLWINVIKAIGPIIISVFGIAIAFGQFIISKRQSKISQMQLALEKQQADIAQKKVELDIRDRRYEVFKRWNEAYFFFKDHSKVNISDNIFFDARSKLLSISEEIFYSFGQNTFIVDHIATMKNDMVDIENTRFRWEESINRTFDASSGVVYKCGSSYFKDKKFNHSSSYEYNPTDYNIFKGLCNFHDNRIEQQLKKIDITKAQLETIIIPQIQIS
ncbi:unnamed protein product [Commensalibacter communis]|nr:unnamed protein product [Commensalibacter communis]CAI3950428.1 unnamed protein product [Commensalibacter communis]CAI3957087.1 unnamed protein product [Commensalibacter communis]